MSTEKFRKFQTADKLETLGLLPDELLFLPEGDQYPFDPTCREIVTRLQELHWKAEGIKVDFWMSSDDSPRPIAVHSIEGTDFRLIFGMRGFRKASESESAMSNVNSIGIPQKLLTVFDDFSGPDYRIYRGLAWSRHKKAFWDETDHYFAYIGSNHADYMAHMPGQIPEYLSQITILIKKDQECPGNRKF